MIMKKVKIAMAGLIVTTLLVPVAAFGDNSGTAEPEDKNPQDQLEEKQVYPAYISFSGTVKEIREREDGTKMVQVENAEGGLFNFIVAETTVMVTDKELKEGAEVTGFYEGGRPMILIYPPQATADVLVVDMPENQSVKVDHFDKDLVSDDNDLKLNIADSTEILLPDGSKGDKDTIDLADKNLVVIYDVTTRSIPAQTTPSKVIVLPERAEAPILAIDEPHPVVDQMPIIVKELQIPGNAYNDPASGTVMVPLRSVAEALGYEVGWDSGKVTIGNASMLEIGTDSYHYMRMAPVELGIAPQLKDGSTYVPLNFFRDVFPMKNAYVFEGQIVINDDETEDME